MNIQRLLLVTAAAASLGACSSSGAQVTDRLTSTPKATNPHSSHVSRIVPSSPIPTPINACTGVGSYSDALDLVRSGLVSLAIRATITDEPQPSTDGGVTENVAVSDYTVIAGNETNGPVQLIRETTANGSEPPVNLLPQGSYVLLLGVTQNTSTYYLADGYLGSFSIDGSDAVQRCPDYNNPGHPLQAPTATTLTSLADYFSKAIAASSTPPSTEPAPSASTS